MTQDAVLEMCLAHVIADQTVAAYARSDLFEKRRVVMNQWAEFLSGDTADGENVVPIRAGEA